jgi:tetratricopeptide (TPR) repeat protein
MLSACLLAAAGCARGPLPEAEARAALARGVAFENAGDGEKAEAAYREAARSEAVRPMALSDRANVLAHHGRYGKAEELYLESIRLSPAAPALNNLAWMYVMYGQKLGEATALAISAAEIAGSPDAAAECYHTAGLAAGLSGDLANATLFLRKGADLQVQSGGGDPKMAFDLARFLLLAERPTEALKALDQSKTPAEPAQVENLRALQAAAVRQAEQLSRLLGAPDH